MRLFRFIIVASSLLSVAAGQEGGPDFGSGRPSSVTTGQSNGAIAQRRLGSGPPKPVLNVEKAPVFAFAAASTGMSRDFGLDGPHMLTYVTLTSSELQWKAKDKTEGWRFSQPAPSDLSTVTIYLGGPRWHQEKESRIIRADGKKVETRVDELFEKPTLVLISLSGKPISETFLKVLKPETLIVLLGPRDIELAPTVSDGTKVEAAHPPESAN
jgi:hypothetical protein